MDRTLKGFHSPWVQPLQGWNSLGRTDQGGPVTSHPVRTLRCRVESRWDSEEEEAEFREYRVQAVVNNARIGAYSPVSGTWTVP